MKQIQLFLLLAIMLIAIQSEGQLNYLFSATTKPYVPVIGGITPYLISDYVLWSVEDEGLATIPIGFTFNYDNKNHTMVNVSVNGFITLGEPFSTVFNFKYFENRLGIGPLSFSGQRPVIAPFWDDLVLADTSDLVYKTTGHAPFRIFTIEWKKAKWVFESPGPVLSIELKLYESTNIIEFAYDDEGGLPDPRFAFASIGITSAHNNRDIIALQSSGSNPDISLLKVNDSIALKPADNQLYRFTPAVPNIPHEFESSLHYTHNTVSFTLHADGIHKYEYAITHSPIPPSSGIITTSSNITLSSLSPETTYYIYGRSRGPGNQSNHWESNEGATLLSSTRGVAPFYSQWVCDSFTTAIPPIELPYIANAEGITPPLLLPADMRQQDFQDTAHHYSPQNGWAAYTDFFEEGDRAFIYFQVDYYNADAWLYTPGLKLTAGKTYQLNFSYLSLYEYNPGDPSSLEVKFGRETGAAAMTSGLLFQKTDISNDEVFQDTVIEFSPDVTGVYYIGFHDMSLYLQGFLAISKISVTEKPGPPEISSEINVASSIRITEIYPNPATDVLNINIESATINNVKMIVTDPSRKIWINQLMPLNQGLNKVTLKTNTLQPGTYFLKIIREDGFENIVKIFIKQ